MVSIIPPYNRTMNSYNMMIYIEKHTIPLIIHNIIILIRVNGNLFVSPEIDANVKVA